MALTDENMVLPVQPMGYGNNNGGFGYIRQSWTG